MIRRAPSERRILKISPVAWHHINFRGRYKFRSGERPIDIEAIVQELAKINITLDFVEAA